MGIGVEEFGLEEFQEGKFWDGELYIDAKKETYQSIGYKRYGVLSVLAAVVSKKARDAMNKSKLWGIKGNMKGDGMATGGTLIVNAGGDKVLLDFRQESPGDHVALVDVLKALSIDEPVPAPPVGGRAGGDAPGAAAGAGAPSGEAKGTDEKKKMECNDDVCQMK